MDHEVRRSGPRGLHVEDQSACSISAIETSDTEPFSDDETSISPGQCRCETDREQIVLQRLSKSHRLVRLARAAQHRLRSPRRPDRVLYFERRVRIVVE